MPWWHRALGAGFDRSRHSGFSMELIHHPPRYRHDLLHAFHEHGLLYNAGDEFGSLVTSSSTGMSRCEAHDLELDLPSLWELYRQWNQLYLDALRGDAPEWVRRHCEHGSTSHEIAAQRLTAEHGLEPCMCRVDYVSGGDARKIAEVQWKSGGLGLFFGIHDVYASVIPYAPGNAPLGDPVERFGSLLRHYGCRDEFVAVNGVRYGWYKAEHYLRRAYAQRGLRYFPIGQREAAGRLVERSGNYYVSEGSRLYRIAFLYGQELLPVLPPDTAVPLAQATLDGKVWMETPLNFIYRQKWGLALPFMDEYRDLFPDRLRRILSPTVLVDSAELDLRPLLASFPASHAERLAAVQTIDDIVDLPASLRSLLVFKCGSGAGEYYSQGRGVFRPCGSRSSARNVLELVKTRVVMHREPWIVQPYVDETYRIELSLPGMLDDVRTVDAHVRLMVFGGRQGQDPPTIIGGLTNFGRDWKVTGRVPGVDAHGNLRGTTFNDIRVQ